MSELLCPKCGRPSTGVCASCFIAEHPIAVKPETFRECECGLTFFKGKWYEDRQEMLGELVSKSIKPPSGVQARVSDFKSDVQGGMVRFDADIDITHARTRFAQNLKWEIRPGKIKCNTCTKQGSGYYEAILQVRDDTVELELDEKQVADVMRTRGGFDYYMISMDYARGKVSDLINRGYLVKQSTKLYGKKNGKDVFRFYYSIKKAAFGPGDFLQYDGMILRVREVGKNVKLTELPYDKPKGITMHRLEDAVVVAGQSDVRKAIITGVRPDGLQVMDADEGHTWEVPPKEGAKHGDEVEYVKIKGKIYIL